jgi:hypothetical protein
MKSFIIMKSMIRKNIWNLLGILIGAFGGYLYYKLVGCQSGTCPITSRPFNSMLYGALMGFLLANIVRPVKSN